MLDRETIIKKYRDLMGRCGTARSEGFSIEAMVLLNYSLRCYLFLVIDKKLRKDKKEFKDKYYKQETNELASTAKILGAIPEELRQKVDIYYSKARSAVIHGILDGEIEYKNIKEEIDESVNLLIGGLQEESIGKFIVGEEESKVDYIKKFPSENL